ncbi:MAG: acylphosphatase [Bacteroidota bacterium]
MPAYSIQVTGKVQGVFFRASTQEKAQSLGVRGWVKNEADGSVLIRAEGDEANLQKLIEWCHQGSTHARVQQVHQKEVEEEGCSDFRIKR